VLSRVEHLPLGAVALAVAGLGLLAYAAFAAVEAAYKRMDPRSSDAAGAPAERAVPAPSPMGNVPGRGGRIG
jgi:hypothetical protein